MASNATRLNKPRHVVTSCPDDGPMLILVAIFESLCHDLATMKRRAMWTNSPNESAGHPLENVLLHTEGPITAKTTLNEYNGPGFQQLCALIFAASGGTVWMDQSSAISWAKKLAIQAPNYSRMKLQGIN